MNINTLKEGNTLTVSPEGRIDTVTAPEFEAAIKDNLGDATELIINFENVEYISSAGLRVLLSSQKMMSSKGSMKLTHVGEVIMEVLEITGFVDILTIED